MKNQSNAKIVLSVGLLLLFFMLVGYAIWSYGLTDPNLLLIDWLPYWRFQQWAWQTLIHNRPLLTNLYILLVGVLFLIYFGITWLLRQLDLAITSIKHLFLAFCFYCLVISPLMVSYNALSHDVFNYIFNARMVVKYQANPHQEVALTFNYDPWTRFMHNTHTPAPYWYGWTAVSILPYLLGFGKFIVVWFNFRLFSLLSIFIYGTIIWFWQKQHKQIPKLWQFAIFFLNPLVLIEIISNAHNDMWMIAPALLAFVLVLKQPRSAFQKIISLGCLLFSISTKYATLILLPIWFILLKFQAVKLGVFSFFSPIIKSSLYKLVPWLISGLLFLPLFSDRSRWFLPWYLIWSMSLLPLLAEDVWSRDLHRITMPTIDSIKSKSLLAGKYWIFWLQALSLSSLMRYVPWLWQGEYSQQITSEERLITWVGGLLFFALFCLFDNLRPKKLWN